MKVKFNHSRQIFGVIYPKGIHTISNDKKSKEASQHMVADRMVADPYFKLMEQAGDVTVIPEPMTPEQLEEKKQADAKAKADADAKLRAEIKAELLAEMEADKKNSSQPQKKS